METTVKKRLGDERFEFIGDSKVVEVRSDHVVVQSIYGQRTRCVEADLVSFVGANIPPARSGGRPENGRRRLTGRRRAWAAIPATGDTRGPPRRRGARPASRLRTAILIHGGSWGSWSATERAPTPVRCRVPAARSDQPSVA